MVPGPSCTAGVDYLCFARFHYGIQLHLEAGPRYHFGYTSPTPFSHFRVKPSNVVAQLARGHPGTGSRSPLCSMAVTSDLPPSHVPHSPVYPSQGATLLTVIPAAPHSASPAQPGRPTRRYTAQRQARSLRSPQSCPGSHQRAPLCRTARRRIRSVANVGGSALGRRRTPPCL